MSRKEDKSIDEGDSKESSDEEESLGDREVELDSKGVQHQESSSNSDDGSIWDRCPPLCLSSFMGQDLGFLENWEEHVFCFECTEEWGSVDICVKELKHNLMVDICEVCRKGREHSSLLLCDACALPYHCSCLDPPLSHPPMNEWFCPPCASVIAQMREGALPSISQCRRVIPGTRASKSICGRVQKRRTNLSSQSTLVRTEGLHSESLFLQHLKERTHSCPIYASSEEGDGPDVIPSFNAQRALPPALEVPEVSNISITSCNVEHLISKAIGKDMLSCKLQFGAKESDFHEALSQNQLLTTSAESKASVTKPLGLCMGTTMSDVGSNPSLSSRGSSSDRTFPQCDPLMNFSENLNQNGAVSMASKHAVVERAKNTSSLLQGVLSKKNPSESHLCTLQKPSGISSYSSSAKDISKKTRKVKRNNNTKQATIECLNKDSSDLHSKRQEKPIGSFSISPINSKMPLMTHRFKDEHVPAKISSSTYNKNFATKSFNIHLASIPTNFCNLSDKKQSEKSQKNKPSNVQDTVPDFRLDILQKRALFLKQSNTKSNSPATKHSGQSICQSSLFHESNTLTGCNAQKLSQRFPTIKATLSITNETKIKDEPPSYETIGKARGTENSTLCSKQEDKMYHNLLNKQLLEYEEQLEVKQVLAVLRNGCNKVETSSKPMSVHGYLSPARRALVPNKRTFYFEQVRQHFNSEGPQKNSLEKDKHNRERDSYKNNMNAERDKFSKKKSDFVKDGPFIETRKRSFEDCSIDFVSGETNLENKRQKMFIKANKPNSGSLAKSCISLYSTFASDEIERLAACGSSKHNEKSLLDARTQNRLNQKILETRSSRKHCYESMCSIDSVGCSSDISQLSNEMLLKLEPYNSPILKKALEQNHPAFNLKCFFMIKEFPDKGRGVITKKAIARGEFVMEYAGELIDRKEAVQREAAYTAEENTGCYMYYFKYCDKNYCIDATKESGHLGRLINHSKKSCNLKARSMLVRGLPRLTFFASRTIEPEEELLYDYGDRRKQVLKSNPWLAQ